MKKKIIALSAAFSAALISSSAFALDGGQINFAGLVSDNTCIPHVNGGSQDGQVQLNTANTTAVNTDPGVQTKRGWPYSQKPFYITVDCGASNTNTKANLSMSSTFFSNSNGTLNNDDSISEPATGVNLAIHEVDSSGSAQAYSQVKINDASNVHSQAFDSNGVAKFQLRRLLC
ncbi:Fimbrial protein YadN [Salmonella bongori]|nr:Fimbrial protein YadN [Salmonella bongori]